MVLMSKIKVIKVHIPKSINLLELGIIRTHPPKIWPTTLRKWRISKREDNNLTDSLTWRRLYAPKHSKENEIDIDPNKVEIPGIYSTNISVNDILDNKEKASISDNYNTNNSIEDLISWEKKSILKNK